MAVAVVFFHCNVAWIYNVAVSGVTFFFLSSAFLLARRHPVERLEARAYGRFVMEHALRLYPLHWLGLALLIVMACTLYAAPINWGATALSALLLHAWSPLHDVHYGIKLGYKNIGWNGKFYTFPYFLGFLIKRWLREKGRNGLSFNDGVK